MDRKQTARMSAGGNRIYMVLGVISAAAVAVGIFTPAGKEAQKQGRFLAKSLKGDHGLVEKILHHYGEAWYKAQAKVDYFRKIEVENRKVRVQNAALKLEVESLRFGGQTEHAAERAKEVQAKLAQATGTDVGRTLASLSYRAPTNLMPSQLNTLGVSYLAGQEYEKAAVIFTQLSELEANDSYKTGKTYLSAAVAWYKLENLKMTETYLDKVLKTPAQGENLRYQAQARLWKAVLAKNAKKEIKVQYWLNDLVDNHPHSREAEWVNRSQNGGESARAPAQEAEHDSH